MACSGSRKLGLQIQENKTLKLFIKAIFNLFFQRESKQCTFQVNKKDNKTTKNQLIFINEINFQFLFKG